MANAMGSIPAFMEGIGPRHALEELIPTGAATQRT